jgi:membrane dipeptidase
MLRKTSRYLLLIGTALLAACAGDARSTPASEDALLEHARGIHQRVLTIDTHIDIPFTFATPEQDPLTRNAQVNLLKMAEGGLDVGFFIVYVGQGERDAEGNAAARQGALQKFAGIHRMTDTLYADRIGLAHSAADVERIAAAGRLVAAIGIENGYVIGNDLALIRRYHDLGARYMTLAHGRNNDICDSSTDPNGPEHGGLSAFGREVVGEMNRVGMMVDISHVSKDCMMQATALSRVPVIASHSSTRALADHPRNLDDEQLLALRDNGGVMQTVAFASYVKVAPAERQEALAALRERFGVSNNASVAALPPDARALYDAGLAQIEQRWPRASVADFVDHIDYAVDLIGIDHVGISSDFDGGGGVSGWNDAAETFSVTLELVRRGYSEEEIAKLWSGNLLRVWRAVEAGAGE